MSSQVAPWVYERFLEKDYVAKDGDFVIYRTEPMTYQCRADSVHFWREKESVVEDFEDLELLRKFEDGEVEVYVYANTGD